MCVSDKLSEVYDSTQHVTEPVQVFDDLEEFGTRLPGAENTVCEESCPDQRRICKGDQGRWGRQRCVLEESGRRKGRGTEARARLVKESDEIFVVCRRREHIRR